ncbi:MAG: CopD family protein [Spirochaetales bacterium]|nr:CopD family protein [Spirochaetales bacterium]
MLLFCKAMHLVGMVAWFAGLFYIWRLYVYAAMNPAREVKEQLLLMAEKLRRLIMLPAAVFTLIFGVVMLFLFPEYLYMLWLQIKLVLVALLIFNHALAVHYGQLLAKELKTGRFVLSHRLFRYLNEMPTLLLIGIVLLAVFRPL